MRHIKDKQEFYAMSKRLLLGNRLVQWKYEEFANLYWNSPESLPKIVGVRHVRPAFTNKGVSGLYPREQAFIYATEARDPDNLIFDEGAVHDHLTLQGEVMADERGLCLRYSYLQVHQRTLWHIDANGIEGLKKHQRPHNFSQYFRRTRVPRWQRVPGYNYTSQVRPFVEYARGLKASAILRKYMDDDSWWTLNEILGCQEGDTGTYGSEINFVHPVVEFACFDCPVGVLGWNAVLWEVRTCY